MSSLEDQSAQRKARLLALKLKRKAPEASPQDEPEPKRAEKEPEQDIPVEEEPVFRNYDPARKDAVSGVDAPPTLKLSENETVEAVSLKIEREILSKFEERARQSFGAKKEAKAVKTIREADLKKDLEPQMKILKARTELAINTMVRKRLQKLNNVET